MEQALQEGAIITTDSAGNCYYLLPNSTNDVLVYDGAAIRWRDTLTIKALALTGELPQSEGRLLSVNNFLGELTSLNPMATYVDMYSISATPNITPDVGAGVGGTAQIIGNRKGGLIIVVVGTTPTLGPVALIDWGLSYYPQGTAISLTPFGDTAALVSNQMYAVGSTTGFTINAATGLTAGTIYKWNYLVEGY